MDIAIRPDRSSSTGILVFHHPSPWEIPDIIQWEASLGWFYVSAALSKTEWPFVLALTLELSLVAVCLLTPAFLLHEAVHLSRFYGLHCLQCCVLHSPRSQQT